MDINSHHEDDEAAFTLWDDLIGHADSSFELLAVQEVARRRQSGLEVAALDTDCGRGELAVSLARAGAHVTAVCPRRLEKSLGDDVGAIIDPALPIDLLRQDLCGTEEVTLAGAPFDVIVCRRSLPFLRYADAVRFVRRLRLWLPIGGKLYMSALGLHSDIGDAYPDSERFIQDRFSALPDAVARRYEIDRPVCLYSERDLFILMFEAGVGVLKTTTTTHGNVKAIGVRL